MVNKAISNLTDTYDLVVTHQDLTARAQQKTPSAIHVSVDNFMGSPRYDEIVELLEQATSGRRGGRSEGRRPRRRADADVLTELDRARRLGHDRATTAITEAGELLVAAGAVDAVVRRRDARAGDVGVHLHGQRPRDPARHQRGQGVDPAHRDLVRALRRAGRLERQAGRVRLGIAGAGNDHLALLSRIAEVFTDKDQVAELRSATSPQQVLDVLQGVQV